MSASPRPSAGPAETGSGYRVITVTELDQMVFRQLVRDGAAKASVGNAGSYVVTDREKALSGNILPKVLNTLGRDGWRLAAVNKMECYIFCRDRDSRYEYKVLTPADLDRAGLKLLEERGALSLKSLENGTPTIEINEPEKATIQQVLPALLAEQAGQGWDLASVSGPQLYFFVRKL